MAALAFDRVLAGAESLPAEGHVMLEELLHRRRIETWCIETAAEAVTAAKAFRARKIKSASAENTTAWLEETT